MRPISALGLGVFVVGIACRLAGADAGTSPAPTAQATTSADEAAQEQEATSDGTTKAPPVDPSLYEAVERNPDDPEALRRLGIALHQSEHRREAVVYFEKTVEISPTERHLLDLALAYASVGRPEDAENTYARLLGMNPRNAIALHNMGNVARNRGDLAEAIEYYEKALEVDPDYLLAHYHLADVLKLDSRYREAYRSFEKVLGLEPKNAQELEAYDNALYGMAVLDLEMGATERAAQFLAELVEAVPDHPKAHYAYGRALTMLGRVEEAQREFDIHMRLLEKQEVKGPVADRD